jgi:hypothetical protein
MEMIQIDIMDFPRFRDKWTYSHTNTWGECLKLDGFHPVSIGCQYLLPSKEYTLFVLKWG